MVVLTSVAISLLACQRSLTGEREHRAKRRLCVRLQANSHRLLTFSLDGSWLAGAARERDGVKLAFWNTMNGKEAYTWEIPDWYPDAIAFSPDRGYLACGLGRLTADEKGYESAIELLDIRDLPRGMSRVGRAFVGREAIGSLAFSPDGRTLAILAQGVLRLWEIPKLEQSFALTHEPAGGSSVAFSPDGKLIAAAMDRDVMLLDPASPKWRATLKHPYGVGSVAFAPDGSTLSACVNGAPTIIWDVKTMTQVMKLQTGYYDGRFTAFSTSAQQLITFGTTVANGTRPTRNLGEGTVLLWDLRGPSRSAALLGPSTGLQMIAFSPRQSLFATIGADNDANVEIWDASGVLPKEVQPVKIEK
jgi:WD40 repeat protein